MTEQNASSSQPASTFQHVVSGLVLVAFFVRYFDVAESAAQGDTLWVVALWFLCLFSWLLVSWKSKVSLCKFAWLDLGVALLAGGHILSAILIVTTTGEKRSAINLGWEWVGILIGWFILRSECRHMAFRREMLYGLVAIGTTMTLLGLYQHYFDFPKMANRYGPVIDRLKTASPTEAKAIREQLIKQQIPVDGSALTLFEKRLRDSREPLGLFALANTFGGFLSVALILMLSLAMSKRNGKIRGASVSSIRDGAASSDSDRVENFKADTRPSVMTQLIWPWVVAIFLLAWCLLLTKSRTAYIGAAAGFFSLVLCALARTRFRVSAKSLAAFGVALLVLVFVGWGLTRIGGLDRQVLTEAPKSLLYRLQYWTATLRIIRQHPLFGVGPGQFRSQYIQCKLPEASEEISDPHNLFLDVTANAGLLALIGLLIVCVGPVRAIIRLQTNIEASRDPRAYRVISRVVYSISLVAWCALLLTGYDDRLLVFLPVALTLYWVLHRFLSCPTDDQNFIRYGSATAAICLTVHLLGAGGIGMPAVSLLLLALVANAEGGSQSSKMHSLALSSSSLFVVGLFSLAGFVGLFITAIRPVMAAQLAIEQADRIAQQGGNIQQITALCRLAAAADNASALPWQRQAEIAYQEALSKQFRSNELFLNAVRLMGEAAVRDPANFHFDQNLGNWWLARWRVTLDSSDANEAARAFQRAWVQYPTSALIMAELATARSASGDEKSAREMAVKAIEQDDLNHQRGHVDRYLDDSLRSRMEKFVKDS